MTLLDFPDRVGQTEPPIETAPHSLEAEQALLGAIMYDNAALERVPDRLQPSHFHEPFHGRLFEAIGLLIRKGQLAEPIILMERFRRDPSFIELGELRYFAELVDRAPPMSKAPEYARIIHDLAVRRALMTLAADVGEGARHDGETSALEQVESAELKLYALAETGGESKGVVTFATAIADALDAAAAAYSRDGSVAGVSTGLIDVDQKLGGLHPSDLVILAGRPSMGKTALATNIAFHVAKSYAFEAAPGGERKTTNGGVVLFFSLEMSHEQLATRVLAQAAAVSSDRIRKGEIDAAEYARLRDAAIQIQESPLYIDDTGGLALGKLAARARRQKRQTGLDLIVVDYLQLVTVNARSGENRVQQVSEVTQGLKALAKELDVPVLALSQLSRQVENREDKKPMLSDLRESGSIEQDADVVAFVYREAYYKGRAEPREQTPEHLVWQDEMAVIAHLAEVIIGKQRHGPIGTVRLHFNEDLTSFTNLARESRFNTPSTSPRLPYGGND